MVFPVWNNKPVHLDQKGKTMTKRKDSISRAELKQALTEDGDFLRLRGNDAMCIFFATRSIIYPGRRTMIV